MKLTPILLALVLFSCGGQLSDEQRKAMREKMEENKIVRVTDLEITEAAFHEGRRVVAVMDSLGADSARREAFAKSYKGDIRFVTPDANTIRVLEQQLIDAYLSDSSGAPQDNVQNVRNKSGEVDSILYTKPVMRTLPDGRDELVGVWNVWISKRELVKEISRNKPD